MTRRSLPKNRSSGFHSPVWLFLVAVVGIVLVSWRWFWRSAMQKQPKITPPTAVVLVPSAHAARPLHQLLWSAVLTVTAIGLLVASAAAFRQTQESLTRPMVLLLLGSVALGIAVRLRYRPEPLTGAVSIRESQPSIQPVTTSAGFLLLLLLAEINGRALSWLSLGTVSTTAQFGLLGMGSGLLVWGLSGFRLPVRLPAVNRREVLVVVALTVLALALRFWQLDTSVRVLVDELNFTLPIQATWSDANIKLLSPFSDITAFPFLFPYWQSVAVNVFGRNFIGLRAVSALLGALTIPAVYLLGRALFDRPVAFMAALLLATFPPHVNFSRIGINNIADPVFGTLALVFLAQGIKSGRHRDYAFAGAALGLTQYFYEGGRLLYPALVAVWLAGSGLVRHRDPHHPHYGRLPGRTGLLIMVLAAIGVALPIYYTLIASGSPLTPRLNSEYALPQDQGTFDFGAYLDQRLLPSFLAYVRQPDSTLFYGGQTPLLLVFIVPAVLLGLVWSLIHIQKSEYTLLLLWLVVTSVGNSLLVDSAQSPRYVVVFPALMLLAAVGLRFVPMLLLPGRALPVLAGVMVALGLAFGQVDYYFNTHLPAYNRQFREILGYRDGQDAILRSLAFPPTTRIHLISHQPLPVNFITGLLRFMTDGLEVDFMDANELTAVDLQRLPIGADHAFYVEPDDEQVIALIKEHFFTEPPQSSPFGLTKAEQFTLYYAPYLPGLSEDYLDTAWCVGFNASNLEFQQIKPNSGSATTLKLLG